MLGTAAIWIPYCGAAPAPGEWLARWNPDPFLLTAMACAVAAWLWQGRALSLPGRTDLSHRRAEPSERRAFLVAMGLLFLLFVSPFCALTSALFSARAVHHLALTAMVAPLFAAALPVRRMPGGWATWTGLHAAIFWLWHAPPAYAAALSNDAIYWLMQASLLLSALALWRAVRAAPPTAGPIAGIAALLATMVQMGLLGALLTFSRTPLYAPHLVSPIAWGLTPLEDQQLAGLIMWAPGAGLYLAAALAILARWFAQDQKAAAPA